MRVIDTGAAPRLELSIQVPIEDMAEAVAKNEDRSIWPSLHGPLLELIRSHRSTLLFVNSRRLAERLSAALNESAGETLTFAHHGSVAKERRREIEEALKNGALRALVATSSLELGIDMGAIDLVVQIGAPPSVSSGLQRGTLRTRRRRALERRRLPQVSRRAPADGGDRGADAVGRRRDHRGSPQPARRAGSADRGHRLGGAIEEQSLFDLVRSAAPFAGLSRLSFDSVLDLLSGRYPSADFAELRPRVVWDRQNHRLSPRQGARQVAIVNGGTIPDRGLYGVFLAGTPEGRPVRVGELDEEMVFESRVSEVFLLGASSWRIDDITTDRVLVSPAPGEPGKMPFWRGDRSGRSYELGAAIGRLGRELSELDEGAMEERLGRVGFDPLAARNLRAYLAEQREATVTLPSDQELVLELFVDEVGDQRVCLLSPFGRACTRPGRSRRRSSSAVRSASKRIPSGPTTGSCSVFPRRRRSQPSTCSCRTRTRSRIYCSTGSRRARSSRRASARTPPERCSCRDAVRVSARRSGRSAGARRICFGQRPSTRIFPIVLETYRECLKDVFDVPSLRDLLEAIARRDVRIHKIERRTPSPYASALLFSYVGNFMYEADAPAAERRAQALTVDAHKLRTLLGEAELRRLLDPDAIAEVERDAGLWKRVLDHRDRVHDLLLSLGERTPAELAEHGDPIAVRGFLDELEVEGRVLTLKLAGVLYSVAVEDAARYRDAFGCVLPAGLPAALLAPAPSALSELISRYARTHGPFRAADLVERYGVPEAALGRALDELSAAGRLARGAFLAGGTGTEYCDTGVLSRIRQQSLRRLRQDIEPVPPRTFARFALGWQSVGRPRRGPGALGFALEQLEGAPLVASSVERELLPARLESYGSGELDGLTSSGEFVWRGLESLGNNDGRIAFYRGERYALLAPNVTPVDGELAGKLREQLRKMALRSSPSSWHAPELFRESCSKRCGICSGPASSATNDTLCGRCARVSPAESAGAGRGARRRIARCSRAAKGAGRCSSAGTGDTADRYRARSTACRGAARSDMGVLTRESHEQRRSRVVFLSCIRCCAPSKRPGRSAEAGFVADLHRRCNSRGRAPMIGLRASRKADAGARAALLAATDPATRSARCCRGLRRSSGHSALPERS